MVREGASAKGRDPSHFDSRKECQIVEAYLIPDQMCIQIAPKHPVSGFSKGKSAMALARLCREERNFGGGHF
jgi:hypothetical protein